MIKTLTAWCLAALLSDLGLSVERMKNKDRIFLTASHPEAGQINYVEMEEEGGKP